MRSAERGEATRWEKSRLSHHLTRMEQRGLICRGPSDTSRSPAILLTDRPRTLDTQCPVSRLSRDRSAADHSAHTPPDHFVGIEWWVCLHGDNQGIPI